MSKKTFANITTDVVDDFDLDKVIEYNYDDGDRRILWSRETFKCYLDNDKPIEFKLVLQVDDLGALCGLKGKVDFEVLLVPLPKYCTKKTLDNAASDNTPADIQDLYYYGCTVLMAQDELNDVDGDEPLGTDVIKDKITAGVACMGCIGHLCGFYLDEFKNRIGNTGWDYLNDWCNGVDSTKAALDRWKAAKVGS